MKNIKHLLLATVALVSASSMAMQPAIPASEDAPFRVTTGLKSGIARVPGEKLTDDPVIRVPDAGLILGFSHNVGYDLEYGLAVGGAWAGPSAGNLPIAGIFTDKAKDASGVRVNAELMVRFMPEVAEKFHVGAQVGVGWGMQFGETAGKMREMGQVAFGDLSLNVGPAFSYGFTDMFSMYFAPAYTLTNIRFMKGDAPQALKDAMKPLSNWSGLQLPVGLWLAASDNVAIFLDVNTKFANFEHFKDTWKEDFTLGVSFAM